MDHILKNQVFGIGITELTALLTRRIDKYLKVVENQKDKVVKMTKKITIRNSTVDFLLFMPTGGESGIHVVYKNDNIWLSQKLMAELFDVGVPAVNKHLTNIFAEGELQPNLTISKMEIVQTEGGREIQRSVDFYNLDAIIAVGYRVNSVKATQFRQWATSVLRDFAIKGYLIDKQRMENGVIFGEDYFDELLAEIREIRLSERRFYQKVTDIFATSSDYDKESNIAHDFFAQVQNKFHYAIHGKTAGEVIVARANSQAPNMGLTSWKNSPDGKIIKTDVSVAKNYLTADELDDLGSIVSAYLDLAENRAKRQMPMAMADWAKHLDKILTVDDRQLLKNKGSIAAEIAKQHAETEYEKFRPIQDRLFQSDFDKATQKIIQDMKTKND